MSDVLGPRFTWARIAACAAAGLFAMSLAATSADAQSAATHPFEPIAKVLTHPRCLNCHPRGDNPLNGEEGRPHPMKITRGPDGLGAPAARCFACHRNENSELTVVPGAPNWHLAPATMAWQGLSTPQLCSVLKDPKLNGGKDLAALLKHMAEDELVLWGWNPGKGRAPVPIPHDAFVKLLEAWAAAGGPCPDR